MDVGKNNNNFKDRKPKYFNWNKYSHIAKKILEEEREGNLKIFQIWQRRHIAKDCKGKQSIKKWKIQEESDNKDNKEKDKKQNFGEDLK